MSNIFLGEFTAQLVLSGNWESWHCVIKCLIATYSYVDLYISDSNYYIHQSFSRSLSEHRSKILDILDLSVNMCCYL